MMRAGLWIFWERPRVVDRAAGINTIPAEYRLSDGVLMERIGAVDIAASTSKMAAECGLGGGDLR